MVDTPLPVWYNTTGEYLTSMIYKVTYKEIHTFKDYIQADSEQEALDIVNEERELRLTFDANMQDDIDYPDPVEIECYGDPIAMAEGEGSTQI